MSDATRVLLVGSAGQVGSACARSVPANAVMRACTHAELDIADASQVAAVVDDFQPEVLINAAAYTAVDEAETDEAAARRCNTEGAGILAAAVARRAGARMVHLSTNLVFDGSASLPYAPEAPTHPLSVYGATKLAGERAVLEALGGRVTILRTAWVYSSTGDNFVRTMLRLMARGNVRVIADQVGTPTSADSLADIIWRIVAAKAGGTFHWTDAGVASWYDFAVAIAEEASSAGLLASPVDVAPIATVDYPLPARRPPYSVLDKSAAVARFGVRPLHWRTRLRAVIEELRGA